VVQHIRHMHHVNLRRVFVGACATSVFVRDCNDCEFTVATRQFRARGCHRCTFHLYSMTQPIIELSSEVVFTPFNGAYPQLEQVLFGACVGPRSCAL
jgi:hypothetical protein